MLSFMALDKTSWKLNECARKMNVLGAASAILMSPGFTMVVYGSWALQPAGLSVSFWHLLV